MSTEKSAVKSSDNLKPQFTRASDFKNIYSNFIQSGFTYFDISLMFGENQGVQENSILVEYKARVTMAPTEAKILLQILQTAIASYENQFGPISLASGVMMPEETTKHEG